MLSSIRLTAALSLLLLLATVFTPHASNAPVSRAPRFSSAYTNLNTQCKNLYPPRDDGQDVPLNCKGFGGYFINIGYSARAAHLSAGLKGSDALLPLVTQAGNYPREKGRKIEWRLADGKPFAIILRVSHYRERTDGGDPFEARYKTGESLLIKGLHGFYQIDYDLNVKTATNPNAKARELADAGYRQIKGL